MGGGGVWAEQARNVRSSRPGRSEPRRRAGPAALRAFQAGVCLGPAHVRPKGRTCLAKWGGTCQGGEAGAKGGDHVPDFSGAPPPIKGSRRAAGSTGASLGAGHVLAPLPPPAHLFSFFHPP